MDYLIELFLFAWPIWLCYALVILTAIWAIFDTFPSLKAYLPWNKSPKLRGRVSHSYRTDPRNRQLQHQLVEMLRGDIAVAKRLLRQQRQKHPGKSDNWYLEKVIYDLERDRRR